MKKNGFYKSSLYLLFAMVFSKGVAFILNILCARYLDKDDFGQLAFLRSTAAMFEGMISGGNNNLVISSVDRRDFFFSVLFSYVTYIVFSILISLILFKISFGGFLVVNEKSFFFMLLMLVFSSLLGMINSIYIARQESSTMVVFSCCSGLVSAAIGGGLIFYESYYGALISFVLYFGIDFLFKFLFFFS
ncbi:hypothetical protein QNE23_004618, partial [Vibrio alginolyticus]|nr:hypothetical protein [Vibrio alginolyticus]